MAAVVARAIDDRFDLEAVEHGEHDVEDDQVEAVVDRTGESAAAIVGEFDVDFVFAESAISPHRSVSSSIKRIRIEATDLI